MMDVRRDIPAGPHGDLDAQARAWIVRLRSGSATEGELARLAGWRAGSPEAEEAFVRARRLWAHLGPALRADADSRVTPLRRPVSRRALIGAGGAAIAACAVAGIQFSRRAAEEGVLYTTRKGQRRRVTIAPGAEAELNTATRARIWRDADGGGLDLLGGEALVTLVGGGSARRFEARIGAAVAVAQSAQFLMRRQGAAASILCMSGRLLVSQGDRTWDMAPNALLRLDAAGAALATVRDSVEAVSWRSGQLVYRDRPLAEVVEELNRYRKGRIVLRDERLAARRVSGVVHLDRIDGALTNFARSLDARIVRLPGDIVVLG